MRSTLPPALLLTATLGAGCLKLNPAYDLTGVGPDTGSSTDGEPTSGSTSAGPTTSSTTAQPTTDGATTGTSTLDPTTGGVDPASTSMSSETDTTGGPTDCWDAALDAFALSPVPPQAGAGSPSLSPDGLSLFFKAPVSPPDEYEVRRLARPTPEDDFGPAEQFFGPADTIQLDYPDVVAGESKIFFTQKGGEIYSARFEDGAWKTWTVAGNTEVFSPQHTESHPNATEDGLLLLFQRDDGPAVGPFRGSFRFYQAALDVATDTFKTAPADVTPKHPDLALPLCPAMSPDGLHLLFAAKDAASGFADVNDGSVGVWSTRRPTPDAPWESPTRSTTLREPGWITCPTSITADGCHATFIRFTYPASQYTMYLGRR